MKTEGSTPFYIKHLRICGFWYLHESWNPSLAGTETTVYPKSQSFHFWYCIRGLLFLSSFGSVSSHFGPHCRMWESLLCLGIELMPWTLGAWSRNHGTPKEVPRGEFSVGSEDLSCGLIDLSLIFLSSFFSFLFSLGLHGIFLVS